MSPILAFDTSAAHCAAALVSGDRVVGARVEEMARGQAERLMPLLLELLADAGLDWRDLSALAVGVGPGNFTGIRISVAAARGLMLSTGLPGHGVSTLEALAHGLPRPVLAVADARRERVYAERFGATPVAAALHPIAALPPELACPGLGVIGDRAEAVAERLGATPLPRPPLDETVAAMARIAMGRGAPAARPAPLYLRPADAAPPRDAAPRLLP
ncbi:tRNA (adenosine(37)-N6)-threonylcarbamoyltransferase complex dimerization subunit type 1 TsaB [Rhodobacteraceae bacterium CCMM004]|nr:tRNA (adenosine(37)-N6)-threonylcarbamoyltransferase complex dimerization subunit type 1 TsaB [Rhodobacteraceae bacterium CCMM004]